MTDIIYEEESSTERVLEWFEKTRRYYIAGQEKIELIKSDEIQPLVGKEIIKSLTLNDLRRIFNVTDIYDESLRIPYNYDTDPCMVNDYPITEDLIGILQPHFEHQIQLEKYSYYISAYRIMG